MPFLMMYWKQLAIVFVVIFAFGSGYYKGYSGQKAKFDAFKAQVEANAKIQKEKNELLLKKQTKISKHFKKEYANAVKKLNAHYASNRVLNHTTINRVPENATAPSTTNGKTESNLPSSTGNTTLDCASDVLQLLYLQNWIKQQLLVE